MIYKYKNLIFELNMKILINYSLINLIKNVIFLLMRFKDVK